MTADFRDQSRYEAETSAARLQAERDQHERDHLLARAQARLGSSDAGDQDSVSPAAPLSPVQASIVETPTARLDAVDPPVPPAFTATQHATPVRHMPPASSIETPGVQAPRLSSSHGDGGLDFIGGERDARDFLRANRHSGRVRVLRIAFPLIGLFILTTVIGAYFWSQSGAPGVTVQSASMDDGRMVMSNPKIDGVDDRQRPYTLIAREAIQDPSALGQVELTGIDAKVPLDEGIFAKILAGKGFYDSDAKTLKLDDSVDIRTDDGVTMTLNDADVDMDAGSLMTANPVSIKTEQAQISANSFTVENNGEKVVFQNRVRMTIFPGKFEQAGATGDQAQGN